MLLAGREAGSEVDGVEVTGRVKVASGVEVDGGVEVAGGEVGGVAVADGEGSRHRGGDIVNIAMATTMDMAMANAWGVGGGGGTQRSGGRTP